VARREKASQTIETARAETARAPRTKLSYREQQELKQLPSGIEALEAEQRHLEKAVAAADFYKEPADTIKQTLARIEAVRDELAALYERWDELDGRTKP
jgi:ATP-binding cassette subfamily F protein uup